MPRLSCLRYLRIIFACLLLATNANAVPTSAQHESELAQVRSKIEALRKDIAATQTRHDAVRSELANIERQMNDVHKQIRKLAKGQRQQESKLSQLGQQEKQLQQDIAHQQDLLARQMRAAYMMGQQEVLKMWLNAQDPAIMGRANRYYDYLHRARTARIAQNQQAIEKLKVLQQDIQRERHALQALQQEQVARKQDLQIRSQERGNIVKRLQAELQTKGQQLATSLEDEKRLQQLVTSLHTLLPDSLLPAGKHQAFGKLKGRLHWPAAGRILDTFGKRRESGTTRTNGVVISADEGRDVRAVSHGRVAYADWLRGYGLLLILDHGDGFMSLYGHTQAIYKEPGEWVEAGELVATVGVSGGEIQPGLYFEIRQNGKPVNPSQWCRR